MGSYLGWRSRPQELETKEQLQELLDSVDTILFDCDGKSNNQYGWGLLAALIMFIFGQRFRLLLCIINTVNLKDELSFSDLCRCFVDW